jgi:5-methylcytosine-specific restriction protein A
MPWYQCPVGGCDGLARKPGRCEKHSKQQDKQHREDRHDDKRYNRARWINLRNAYKTSNPLCENCIIGGITKVADVVHHIIPVRDGGDWYRQDNLMSLCNACHGVAHHG